LLAYEHYNELDRDVIYERTSWSRVIHVADIT
jgi:hypothetical protein